MVGIYFISKETQKIADSVAEIRLVKTELKKQAEFAEIYKKANETIGTTYPKIEAAFIPSDNILEFIAYLDKLSIKYNAGQVYRFETLTPSSISIPFQVSTIIYSNNLTTNVSNFSNYLKEFEKLPYLTKIEGLSIQSQDKMGWIGQSSVSFRATLYTKTIQ